jgi:hypothetical protein
MSRYSQLYIERKRRGSDSERARVRLHALFEGLVSETYHSEVASLIKEELGIKIRQIFHPDSFDRILALEEFFNECEVSDLLDFITIIYHYLKTDPMPSNSEPEYTPYEIWRAEVSRILAEENLAYRIDTDAIVHPYVDVEFEINQTSALEALRDPMFGEARTDFEAAHRHLRGREYKQAIRMMFPAVEVAAKVLFPGAFSGLTQNEVERRLKPQLVQRYAGNEPAIAAGRQLLEGMKNWINATQLYRHGQEQQEPAEPPEDFVIAHLSSGATYLRWMIELVGPLRSLSVAADPDPS